MLTTGRVQDCGCIALPEEIQQRTGLYPGANFQLDLTPEGTLLLVPVETVPTPPQPGHGVQCG